MLLMYSDVNMEFCRLMIFSFYTNIFFFLYCNGHMIGLFAAETGRRLINITKKIILIVIGEF